ncbi:MAG: cbb3-type cytochrome c oxidase subunit 3 [Bdellovibrionales bacterium]
MKSKFLTQLFTNVPLTVAGLILFFSAFLALIFWVYLRCGAKQQYEAIARLPLVNDGESYE